MKNSLVSLLLFVLAGSVQAQLIPANQVPVLVLNTLKKQHPQARNLQWERSAPYYEAVFTLNNNHRAIKFDTQGRVAETEVGIPIGTLRVSIAQYMKKHYPAERIQAAETVTKANGGESYEIRITGMEIVFNAAGTFLNEEKD
ncbi:PepSY-like domain-containing protein [Spirosoma utsteinense]|uniref:PepSY-like domain-containing protein n=1 Tax=Spirosoma utsteinense TaxID=2585773 RepID=UPI0016455BBF|nr:PepSY-like domain-containing protein [Spirosoma utsteinense]MBC3787778.1 energy-converting hydrogenase Eha subunit A [Spirosoma utsteinense]